MSVHSTPPRLVRNSLLWTLVVFLGAWAFAIFGAQEPEPDAPATPVTGDAPTGPGADPAAQPIAFSHAHHVTEVGVDCQFCHAYARRGPVAGIPSVQRCGGCHRVVLNEQPEILKMLEYWENEEPIPWVRVSPSLWHGDGVPLGVIELLVTAGVLGLFAWCYTTFLQTFPMLPLSDPRLEPASAHPYAHDLHAE